MNIEQIKKALIEYGKEIYYVDKTYGTPLGDYSRKEVQRKGSVELGNNNFGCRPAM